MLNPIQQLKVSGIALLLLTDYLATWPAAPQVRAPPARRGPAVWPAGPGVRGESALLAGGAGAAGQGGAHPQWQGGRRSRSQGDPPAEAGCFPGTLPPRPLLPQGGYFTTGASRLPAWLRKLQGGGAVPISLETVNWTTSEIKKYWDFCQLMWKWTEFNLSHFDV